MPLTILAHVTAHDGQEQAVHAALKKLQAASRTEKGCIRYDMHIDNTDPRHIVFYEIWETRDLWLDHMKAPHLIAHQAETEKTIASVDLYELTRTD